MVLQDKKIMPPPWLAHREIERYSIGWTPSPRRSGRNTAPSFPNQ